jgi:hypothetical protein
LKPHEKDVQVIQFPGVSLPGHRAGHKMEREGGVAQEAFSRVIATSHPWSPTHMLILHVFKQNFMCRVERSSLYLANNLTNDYLPNPVINSSQTLLFFLLDLRVTSGYVLDKTY